MIDDMEQQQQQHFYWRHSLPKLYEWNCEKHPSFFLVVEKKEKSEILEWMNEHSVNTVIVQQQQQDLMTSRMMIIVFVRFIHSFIHSNQKKGKKKKPDSLKGQPCRGNAKSPFEYWNCILSRSEISFPFNLINLNRVSYWPKWLKCLFFFFVLGG